jgi:hypothetical protein
MLHSTSTISYKATIQPSDEQMREVLEADKTRDLENLVRAIVNTVAKYNLSLQQIEKGLREKNCYTWLIARKINGLFTQNTELRFPPRTGTKRTYSLFLTTRSFNFAREELLQESKDYEENFKKLSDTGMPFQSCRKPLNNTLPLNSKIKLTHHQHKAYIQGFENKAFKIFMDLFAGVIDTNSKIYRYPLDIIITIIKTLDVFEKHELEKYVLLK